MNTANRTVRPITQENQRALIAMRSTSGERFAFKRLNTHSMNKF